MHLQKLDVHGLRNLSHVQLSFSPEVNLFYGANGSGKTSLLEAIHLLGRGRSFRCRTLTPIINRDVDSCTVFGLLEKDSGQTVPVGVNRSRDGAFTFKLNGQVINNASTLAEAMPLLVLNSDSFHLLDGGPQFRRQYVDWGVFHVEHNCRGVWQKFRRALKQRNSLLRHDRIDETLMLTWDEEFSSLAEQINQYRERYLNELIPKIQWVVSELSLLREIEFKHYAGWDKSKHLREILLSDRKRDVQTKVTAHGPHRADLRVKYKNQSANDVLSRGQIKILVTAMQIAQGFLFHERTGSQCIYLLDDLPSELDSHHRKRVGELLKELGAQTFITGVMSGDVESSWPMQAGDINMFHVEHGVITQQA